MPIALRGSTPRLPLRSLRARFHGRSCPFGLAKSQAGSLPDEKKRGFLNPMTWSTEQLDSFTTLLEQRRKLREIAQLVLSLSDFFRAAWKVIEPETKLCWSWHYEYIAEFL